jgi:hypothetical protein
MTGPSDTAEVTSAPSLDGRTHYVGCWAARGHQDCAMDEIARLSTIVEQAESLRVIVAEHIAAVEAVGDEQTTARREDRSSDNRDMPSWSRFVKADKELWPALRAFAPVPIERSTVSFTQLRALVEGWIAKRGHDACWYYPDIFRALAAALGIACDLPDLPTREEFVNGCRRFADEQFPEPTPTQADFAEGVE